MCSDALERMNILSNAINFSPLKPPTHLFLSKPPLLHTLTHHIRIKPKTYHNHTVTTSSCLSEIDMERNPQGIFTAKPKKVVVLWDLDNKPPRGPPYQAALSLKQLAQRFGDVVEISAYANRHAFIHLPHWVLEERRERRHLDILERKGLTTPTEPYICGVCGRKCTTNLDLKKHFRQLHEREREKKLNRMRSLKGKKRIKFKERFITGNDKYMEAAKSLIKPKAGYGLASELRRAGVFVKTVEDKPQAADWAVKRQMQHSMSRGVDWLFLVSDDSDFADMLRRARDSNLGTVVVGDWDRALGRHADLWVPWIGVENGEISDDDLLPRRPRSNDFSGEAIRKVDLDCVVDELVGVRTEFNKLRISNSSQGDWVPMEMRDKADNDVEYEDDFLSDSDHDEETEEEDMYY